MENRIRTINTVVLDQADFFQNDGFTRRTGLTVSDISVQVFQNNTLLNWTLLTGVGVNDESVRSGFVYWNEVSGAPGIYSVRFRPSAIGYWRVILTYTAGSQIAATDLDIIPDTTSTLLSSTNITPRFL
jgi:hypothetical protein